MTRHFTKKECEQLIDDAICTDFDEPRRWARGASSVIKVDDKYYVINWDQGLTEYQENSYWDQDALEVKEIEETIIVKKWIPVEDNT